MRLVSFALPVASVVLEVVSKSLSDRWLRWHALEKGRCLDGSPMGMYFEDDTLESRLRRDNGIFVYFQGGGWCEADDEEGTLEDCYMRSQGLLGSSNGYREWVTASEWLMRVSSPYYHIYVPYCDGTSFTGNASVYFTKHNVTIYFEGHIGMMEIIKELQKKFFTLKSRTDSNGALMLPATFENQAPPDNRTFIISGTSAGASTVFYHIDKIAAGIREVSPGSRVIGAPDSGFFLDVPSCWGTHPWTNSFWWMAKVANSFGNLHQGCLKKFTEKDWYKCLYEQNYAELIDSKVIILQSLFDYSEVTGTLDVYCDIDQECSLDARLDRNPPFIDLTESSKHVAMQSNIKGKCCTEYAIKCVHNLKMQHLLAMTPMLQDPKHGHWLVACVKHGVLGLPVSGKTTINNITADEAVHRFVNGESVKMVDVREWPLDSRSKFCRDDGPYGAGKEEEILQ